MRKILWTVLFFMAYVYLATTGKDQIFVEKGKAIYEWIANWLDDAELDFHLKKEPTKKQRRSWR